MKLNCPAVKGPMRGNSKRERNLFKFFYEVERDQ